MSKNYILIGLSFLASSMIPVQEDSEDNSELFLMEDSEEDQEVVFYEDDVEGNSEISLIEDSDNPTVEKQQTPIDLGCFYHDFKCDRRVLSIYADWIYFKAIEDSLKYAQSTPQDATVTPKSSSINQGFDYTSGLKVGFSYQLPKNRWEIAADWMWYGTHNPQKSRNSSNFGILASMDLPAYGIAQNGQVNHVSGKWSLNINSIDLKLNMPLHLSKKFILTPSGGIMAGFVDQNIHVDYRDFFLIQPAANTPQEIRAHNNMWGVGPMIGLGAKFILMKQLGLFFDGSISGLCGEFSIKTVYQDILNAPSDAKITIKDSQSRVSLVEQLRAGIETNFITKKNGRDHMQFIISAGWEVQVWTRQLRLNLFDTFVEPSEGADLTLYGPFVRGEFRF